MSAPSPDFTVQKVDDERTYVTSNDRIRISFTYDKLYELEVMLAGAGSSMDVVEKVPDILAKGKRHLLQHAWRNAQDVIGLAYFVMGEYEWTKVQKPPMVAEQDDTGKQNFVFYPQQNAPTEKVSAWASLARAVENVTSRIVEQPKGSDRTALQRIRDAKNPMEMAFLLGQAVPEIDDWIWGKAIVNYDDAAKRGGPEGKAVCEYYNAEVKRVLKKWCDMAEAIVKFSDHFIDHRMLDLEHNVAKSEAVAKAAMLSRPIQTEAPKPTA